MASACTRKIRQYTLHTLHSRFLTLKLCNEGGCGFFPKTGSGRRLCHELECAAHSVLSLGANSAGAECFRPCMTRIRTL